jgi:hypothetical protein
MGASIEDVHQLEKLRPLGKLHIVMTKKTTISYQPQVTVNYAQALFQYLSFLARVNCSNSSTANFAVQIFSKWCETMSYYTKV